MSSSNKVKRHLKVRAELSPDRKTVTMKILEQTHKGYLFSQLGKGRPSQHRGCFAQERVILYDIPYCDSHFAVWDSNTLHLLLGTAPEIKIPIQYWKEVKAAIQTYNACDSWSDED